MAAYYEALSVKTDQTYTSCYCEENVWKLCEKIQNTMGLNGLLREEKAFAVFISNDNRTIPLWHQSSGDETKEGLVIWDYHVILVIKENPKSMVFDLDTRLPYPSSFNEYSRHTFSKHEEENMREQFHRKFRVIPIREFLENFASDRSHMKDRNGDWIKQPPEYPCIKTKDSTNNIQRFISMENGWGKVMSLEMFNETFCKESGEEANAKQ